MQNKEREKLQAATNSGPRPGEFALGSPQSRAAARLLLTARTNGARESMRVIIRPVVGQVDLAKCTCTRRLNDDILVEIVDLDGSLDTVTREDLDAFVDSFPIEVS